MSLGKLNHHVSRVVLDLEPGVTRQKLPNVNQVLFRLRSRR